MAVDSQGNLFVADSYDHRISKITPDGRVSIFAGYPQPFEPGKGVTEPPDRQGWVDGPGSRARFRRPTDIAIDADDNLYVADAGNLSVRKVSPEGLVSTLYGRGAPIPMPSESPPGTIAAEGIAVDASGTVYVSGGNRIRRLTPTGDLSIMAGDGTLCQTVCHPEDCSPRLPDACFAEGIGEQARFFEPKGLAVDAVGRLYVADSYNGRIRVIQ